MAEIRPGKKEERRTTRQKYNGLPYSIGWPIKKKEREKTVTTVAKCNGLAIIMGGHNNLLSMLVPT